MAWSNDTNLITLPFQSTGIRQYRAVVADAATGVDYPNGSTANLQPITGVLISSGTTGSTDASAKYGTIQIAGVAKIEAASSTLAAGNLCSASTLGQVTPASTAGVVIGRVIDGSSGGANRVLSVHISQVVHGTTATLS